MEDNNSKISAEQLISTLKQHKPSVRNQFDAISILLHTVMVNLGYKLVSDSNKDVEGFTEDSWNSSNDSYSFRYKHPKKDSTIIIKNLVLGESLLVNAITEPGSQQSISTEIKVGEFIKSRTFGDGVDFDQLYNNLPKLTFQFMSNVLSKAYPPVEAERRPDPLREDPPFPSNRPYHQPGAFGGFGFGIQPPFGVGSSDLNPSGPGFGFNPPGGGGSLVGPDHPSFGNMDPYANGYPGGGLGPFPPGGLGGRGMGRGGRPPGVPPDARFDPFGPPGFNFPPGPDHERPPGWGDF